MLCFACVMTQHTVGMTATIEPRSAIKAARRRVEFVYGLRVLLLATRPHTITTTPMRRRRDERRNVCVVTLTCLAHGPCLCLCLRTMSPLSFSRWKAGVQRRTTVFCNPSFLVPSCLRRRLLETWKKPERQGGVESKTDGACKLSCTSRKWSSEISRVLGK